MYCVRLKRLWLIGLLASSLAGVQALAGVYLVQGGTITHVTSTNGNTASFAVQVTGGSVNSCVGVWINFNQVDAADADTFKRAFAAALLAYTTGNQVLIYNYLDTTCQRAGYIELN